MSVDASAVPDTSVMDVKQKQAAYHDWEAGTYDDKFSISYDQRCIDYARDRFVKAVPRGRVHGRVRTGVYTLRVTAQSADGRRETAESRVRVVGKQLRHRQMMVRQDVGSGSTTAALPKRVAAAFAVGPVSVRVRTDASVTGPAALTFSNDGVTRSIRLRDGVHVTKRFALFKGFEQVAIGHRWAKGAAELRSVEAVWSYSELR